MKKILSSLLLILLISPTTLAGECHQRHEISKEATISSAVFLRDDCPEGAVIGTLKAGEVVKLLEVDIEDGFYLVESSLGQGLLWRSFLKNIHEVEPPKTYEDSIFIDLSPDHQYYSEISQVKEQGIVNGNPDGTIQADEAINRAALAKILVESISSDDEIYNAKLGIARYSDADTDAWYAPYLELANLKGIMTGDEGKDTVRPADGANGAEVAKMIVIAFDLELKPAMYDNDVWYSTYLQTLEDLNALPYDDADHQVTRGEMMYIIAKVLDSVELE